MNKYIGGSVLLGICAKILFEDNKKEKITNFNFQQNKQHLYGEFYSNSKKIGTVTINTMSGQVKDIEAYDKSNNSKIKSEIKSDILNIIKKKFHDNPQEYPAILWEYSEHPLNYWSRYTWKNNMLYIPSDDPSFDFELDYLNENHDYVDFVDYFNSKINKEEFKGELKTELEDLLSNESGHFIIVKNLKEWAKIRRKIYNDNQIF